MTATTKPLALMFSISPGEFELGTCLALNAKVIDVSMGDRFTGYRMDVTFFDVSSNGFISSFSLNTTLMEEAITNIMYPPDLQAHAYMALIVPAI